MTESWSVQAQIRAFAVEHAIKGGALGDKVVAEAKKIEAYVGNTSDASRA